MYLVLMGLEHVYLFRAELGLELVVVYHERKGVVYRVRYVVFLEKSQFMQAAVVRVRRVA